MLQISNIPKIWSISSKYSLLCDGEKQSTYHSAKISPTWNQSLLSYKVKKNCILDFKYYNFPIYTVKFDKKKSRQFFHDLVEDPKVEV